MNNTHPLHPSGIEETYSLSPFSSLTSTDSSQCEQKNIDLGENQNILTFSWANNSNSIVNQEDTVDNGYVKITSEEELEGKSALFIEEEAKRLDQEPECKKNFVQDLHPLLQAAKIGNLPYIQAFFKGGGELSSSDNHGLNALHYSARHGHLKVFNFLISAKGDLSAKSKDGSTVWHYAAANSQLEILELLSKPYLFEGPYSQNLPNPWEEVLFLTTNNYGQSPHSIALAHDYVGVKTLLHALFEEIAQNLQTNKTEEMYVKIFLACANGDVDFLKSLLEEAQKVYGVKNGIQVNMNAENFYRPQTFLQEANVILNNCNGYRALYRAIKCGHVAIIQFLASKRLLPSGLILDDISTEETLLHVAIMRGHLNIVKMLHNNKADIEKRQRISLKAPLHYAAEASNPAVLQYLIEYRANLYVEDRLGRLPMHLAARHNIKSLQLLMQSRWDIPNESSEGCLMVHYAAMGGQLACLEFLAERRADLKAICKKGKTPLDYAKERGDKEVIEWLTKRCD